MQRIESMPSMPRAFTRVLGVAMLGITLAVVLAACGPPVGDLQPGTFERGKVECEHGFHTEGIEDLKLFIRRNPTHPEADDAQFTVGMCYFEAEDYPLAAVEFQIMRADYPDSDLLCDAFYQEGLCYSKQVPPIRLEQTATQTAIAHFERFMRSHPECGQLSEVRGEVERLRLHLDRKQVHIAKNYLRWNQPRAAQITANALLLDRPDSPVRPEALFVLGKASAKLDEAEEARAAWQEIVTRFPEHELANEAQDLLDSIAQLSAGSSR